MLPLLIAQATRRFVATASEAPRYDGQARIRHREARSAVAIQSRVPPLSATSLSLSSSAMKRPYVYIMASRRNGTLYVGVTSDIARRAAQHREDAIDGFTKRYGCKLLVRMEPHERMDEAIAREKQIKSGSRKDKLGLIETIRFGTISTRH
jgi:putative endonuclease